MRRTLSFLAGLLMWSHAGVAADKVVLFQNLSPISGVTIVAAAKGVFAKHGLDVEVRNVTSGKLALDALIGGSAQLATVAETPVMRAGVAGQEIAIIATMEASDNDVQFLTRADRSIKTLADLKGKKIATAVGTSAEYMVYSALQTQGLKMSDVAILNLRPQDMAGALERGDIDVYAIWEPHIHNGKKLLAAGAVELPAKGIYVETFSIVGMRDYLKKNGDIAQRFIKALIEAEGLIASNKDEAVKIIAQAVQMDAGTMASIWSNYQYKVALDASILTLMKKQADWDAQSGKPANVPDVDKAIKGLVQIDFLKAVAPDRISGF